MIIEQFNTTEPNRFEANRTQVNVGITPKTKTTTDGEVEGYEYFTVCFEHPQSYTDDALFEIANKTVARDYLLKTDWYVVRLMDSGVEIPQEVKDKRAEARLVL